MRFALQRAGGAAALALSGLSVSFSSPSPSGERRAFNTQTASGYKPARPFRVGVLGATGAVGQRFLEHLEGHPWFTVVRLGASERSAGKVYSDAANWMVSPDVPSYLSGMKVVGCTPEEFGSEVDLVFSALVRVAACGALLLGCARPAPPCPPPSPRSPTPTPPPPPSGRPCGCCGGACLPGRWRASV
jgi:hypothetical protein